MEFSDPWDFGPKEYIGRFVYSYVSSVDMAIQCRRRASHTATCTWDSMVP